MSLSAAPHPPGAQNKQTQKGVINPPGIVFPCVYLILNIVLLYVNVDFSGSSQQSKFSDCLIPELVDI